MDLVLSIFPGIDLLGRGFEEAGFSVVRGPDLIWGGDIRRFHVPAGKVSGVIGGSPCPDFSKARRAVPSGNGLAMLAEFVRVVLEARPDWFLLENVPGVPDIVVEGYTIQRFNLNARECGVRQNRLRAFQFGFRDGPPLVIRRAAALPGPSHCCLATEGTRKERRTFADFCELQGLPRDFDLPGLSVAAKYRAVGNGVPVPMARVVATAINLRTVTPPVRVCACECGRPLEGRQTFATAACRKRMQRKRDAAGVTGPGFDTPAQSQDSVTGRPAAGLDAPRRDAPAHFATWLITALAVLLIGCRAPTARPQPPLPARMSIPGSGAVGQVSTLPANPLRLLHPVPSLRWRGWNPSVGATITTTNTGLFGIDWVAPVDGREWLLQVSSDLSTWSDGVPIGDRWQGLFPFRDSTLFFRVLESQP